MNFHSGNAARFECVTIGDATLYRGDWREVLPLQRFALVLTDPPYGIGEAAKNHKSRNRNRNGKPIVSPDYGRSDWDDEPPTHGELALLRASAEHAIFWGGNYFTMGPASKWLVWDKMNSGDFADCELAWTSLPGAVRIFRHMWNGMMRDSERGTPRVHPTQKPIALMEWCLLQAAPTGVVLDPYMGRGTTGIACARMGIPFVGIEREAQYFDAACEQIGIAVAQGVLPLTEQPRAPEQLEIP